MSEPENGGVLPEEDGYLFPTVDYRASARARARRQERADAMIARSQQGGGMVGPIYVGKNPLASLAEAGVGSYLNAKVDAEEKQEAQQLQDIRRTLMERMSAGATPAQRQALQLAAAGEHVPGLRDATRAAAAAAWGTPKRQTGTVTTAGGRRLLVDPETGATIKDLGAASEGNRPVKEAYDDQGNLRIFEKDDSGKWVESFTAKGVGKTKAPPAPSIAFVQTVGPDGQPVTRVVDKRDVRPGDTFEKPPAAEKQPTESERGAAGYLGRMQAAEKILGSIGVPGQSSYATEAAGGVPTVGGAVRRAVETDAQQRYRQAQEDWVRAKLRKESGAVIGVDEMRTEIETYFPKPGDTPGNVRQKAQARRQAEAQMMTSAGRAKPATPPPGAAPQAAVDYLKAHPEAKEAFKAKYGYLP